MTEEISHSSSCHLLGNYYALKGTNGQVALEQHLLKDKRYSSKKRLGLFKAASSRYLRNSGAYSLCEHSPSP